jgi:hypothetical protein
MKKYIRKQNLSKGQILPIVVLMMFAIIAMVAVVLDGGVLMFGRRGAQAAADAGALAGAQRLCEGYTVANVINEAVTYATANNDATSAAASVSGNQVSVTTTIDNPSFFAKIFGVDQLQSNAYAVATCSYPTNAQRVLPIAFYYRTPALNTPPEDAEEAECETDGSCSIVTHDYEELLPALDAVLKPGGTGIFDPTTKQLNLPLDNIYIIADNTKVCEKDVSGNIVCADAATDTSGGNRSWIDLNLLNDKNKTLSQIVQEGIDNALHTPAWLNGEPGVVSAVYDSQVYADFDPIEDYEYMEARLFFVPVYDMYCANGSSCETNWDGVYDYTVNQNQQAYRLTGFGGFVVTCVTKNSTAQYGAYIPKNTEVKIGDVTVETDTDICPGFLAQNPDQDVNESAIEGYFVVNYPVDEYLDGIGGVNLGIWLISLVE